MLEIWISPICILEGQFVDSGMKQISQSADELCDKCAEKIGNQAPSIINRWILQLGIFLPSP